MKKLVIFILMVCAMAAVGFAQSYTVQAVTGRVQREEKNTRIDVKIGDTLSADTIIHTGVGASLVLKNGDITLTVPAVRDGKTAELAAAGVKITGSAAKVDTTAVNRTTAQASTASARASDAAEEPDIAAESKTEK